ncbi:diguanylate cyclase domain-containing protein, partial [Lysobacter xanthus]
VAFIHLDDVAAINERHGHDAGDRFLAAVARALDATLRGGDLLARVGGDVFVVAGTVPRESADAAGDVLRDRLQAAMHARFDLGGGVAIEHAGARVGLVLARPGEIDAEAVLARGVGAGGSASGAAR